MNIINTKKFLGIALSSVIGLSISMTALAEPVRLSQSATNVLFTESAKGGFYLRDEGNYQPWAYNIVYATNFERALPGVTMVERSDGTVHMNVVGEADGQCAPFVKAMTNMRGIATSSWKPGIQVTPNARIEPNTAIATFANGKYNGTSGGHTAIYLFSLGKQGIVVLDQNWRTTGGKPGNAYQPGNIAMHLIPFTGKGGTGDAYSYRVVEK